jgi:hypothetical protein
MKDFADASGANAAFGYRLSPQFVQLLFRSYDRRGQDSTPQPAGSNGFVFMSCASSKLIHDGGLQDKMPSRSISLCRAASR